MIFKRCEKEIQEDSVFCNHIACFKERRKVCQVLPRSTTGQEEFMNIAELGNGSWIMGILVILFGLIGLINAFAAFMMWFKEFTEWLERLGKKGKPHFLLWIIIIVVTFGWYALFKIINLYALTRL